MQTTGERRVREPALKRPRVGKAVNGKPMPEPDSGNPTVRDRRGASGNVTIGSRTEAQDESPGIATGP